MKTIKYSVIPAVIIPIIFMAYGAGKSNISSKYESQKTQAIQKPQPKISAANGHKIAQDNGCFRCHSVDGSERGGPSWKNLYGSKVQLKGDSTVIADSAYIVESIKKPSAEVVKGYPPIMPVFSNLSDTKIKSIIVYIQSLSDKKAPKKK